MHLRCYENLALLKFTLQPAPRTERLRTYVIFSWIENVVRPTVRVILAFRYMDIKMYLTPEHSNVQPYPRISRGNLCTDNYESTTQAERQVVKLFAIFEHDKVLDMDRWIFYFISVFFLERQKK